MLNINRAFLMKHAYSSILAGIIIGTSYIPFPPWGIFFGFVPLWLVWLGEKNSYKQIFWSGWLTQFVFTFIGFNWVSYTLKEFGHFPWPLAVFVLMLFCAIANLYVPVVGVVWAFVARRLNLNRPGQILALVILLSVGERISPMIFDWHMGYTWLWAKFPAFHLADVIGFIGLANIGLAFNGLLLVAVLRQRQRQPWIASALCVPVLFLVLNVIGLIHGRTTPPPDALARILLVQANIDNQEKLAAKLGPAYRATVIQRWLDLTIKGVNERKPDFVVWAETAFPEVIDNPTLEGRYPQLLREAILQLDTKFITGGYSVLASNGRYTNSMFALSSKGEWLDQPYHKTVLLAFGEYFPFADNFPALRKMFPQVGDYGRGPGPTVLNADGFKVGAQICYEGLFDWFSRDLANKGAHFIVNLTNDAWYGRWQQPYQHAYMTFARAIETRRPLIRSTNSGISAVALASGQVLHPSPIYEAWYQHYDVPYQSNPQATIFMGWGFWLLPMILLLAALALCCPPFRETHRRS